MAGKILDRIRDYARQDKLNFSKHAYDEMRDDEYALHIDPPKVVFQQDVSLEQVA
ncbi:MAG: hypothetical protein ONB46_09910 [candidate division KSB1 bacterium]|nr:hypothetical protein [candidate division KSB1 bacterium]MDZ7366118.1 hypothetical protein [candidate division KSB1 bacterium]MDZ7404240.1 hypothetical protein [candidate division KSB1 bacterium]